VAFLIKYEYMQFIILYLVVIWAGFIVLDSATYLLFALILCVGYDFLNAKAMKAVVLFLISLSSVL
jgi:uncharacterized protein